MIKQEFLKDDSPKQETRLVKDIKLKCNDISYSKADKGNTVVDGNKAEYLNKTFDFLKSGSFKRNSTENFQKYFKSTLHNSRSIISTNEHGYPIRPVVYFYICFFLLSF